MNMFTKPKGMSSLKEPVAQTSLIPIQSADRLISGRQIAQIVKNLPPLIDIPNQHYEALYAKAISNYAAFVQMLPVYKSSTYHYQGGLLDLGIARAYFVVTLFLKNRLPKGGILQDTEKTPLWIYALFTAGLYYQLGFLATNLWVTICDDKGAALSRWNPFAGHLLEKGHQFRYCLDPVNRDILAARITPMLAQLILPSEGLLWLSGDREVFEYWIAVLQNDERAGGVFAAFVMQANELLLAQDLSFLTQLGIPFPDRFLQPAQDAARFRLNEQTNPKSDPTQFLPHVPASMSGRPTEKEIAGGMANKSGVAFLEWFNRGIREGTISLNMADSLAHIVSAGVLMLYPEIFRQFIKDNPQFPSWQEVQNNLQAMGVLLPNQNKAQKFTTEKTATHKFALGESGKPIMDVSRAVLMDPAFMFANGMMPPPNTTLKNIITVNHQLPPLFVPPPLAASPQPKRGG